MNRLAAGCAALAIGVSTLALVPAHADDASAPAYTIYKVGLGAAVAVGGVFAVRRRRQRSLA